MIKNLFPWQCEFTLASKAFLNLPLRYCVSVSSIETDYLDFSRIDPQSHQLQLRQNFIMILNTSTQQIQCFFQCQPNVSILIQKGKPANKIYHRAQQTNSTDSTLMKIIYSGDKKYQICLFLDCDAENPMELYRTFARTYTIQLDFHQLFKPVRKIGQGATSVVYMVNRKADDMPLAVKAFKKSAYFQMHNGKGKEAFFREFKMLSQCEHQGICRFKGTYETDNTIYIVQEYYPKSLNSLLRSKDLSRMQVLSIMSDLLGAVQYLHSQGIFHRDIKLDNIMIKGQNDAMRPVLIDLGMAHYIDDDNYLFMKCGTPGFIAPEIFDIGSKSPKGDVFSLGVIFHILLFKTPVFLGNTQEEVIMNNKMGKMTIEDHKLGEDDMLIRDLLLKMLDMNLETRISAQQALLHPLFHKGTPLTPRTSLADSQAISQIRINFSNQEESSHD